MVLAIACLAGIATAFEYPPAAMSQAVKTFSSSPYGAGTYEASASSNYSPGPYEPFRAFDKCLVVLGCSYTTGGGFIGSEYNGPNGVFIGSTWYGGEWLQLKLPMAITLVNYTLVVPTSPTRPVNFVLIASSSGSTWALLDTQSGTMPTPGSTFSFTVPAVFRQPYQYYRILIQSAAQEHAGIAEWYLYDALNDSPSNTPTVSVTPSVTASPSPTTSITATVSRTASETATISMTPTNTATPTQSPCRPGQRRNGLVCQGCSPGSYSAGFDAAACGVCPPGTWSSLQASSCTTCPAGTYSQAGADMCISCQPTMYCPAGASNQVRHPRFQSLNAMEFTRCCACNYRELVVVLVVLLASRVLCRCAPSCR